ncbi:hypothetical protein MRB53_027404 [Persea americana]|uniref:Uncharacterized protein n=1 Tax=Persea americana TaxID=3435 RepID=A0ACC2LLI6_PERAE|nr:hypothetical protein MRB53_027404 [Persea americana]|eukprot:TRINITY_DN6741_c0_g1_i1.p1 TRINITY_DN6741_c0_g1~~TRINITY_DN6741_c0_g1_i1.p1  ORF type:complete len:305 (+),score=56.40 TRINITY_DN6741_c0_g1_i1:221-1135(+)
MMMDSHPPSDPAPSAINGGSPENLGPSLGSKRQRRPSVRLGDIGEQSAAASSHDSYPRRFKQWKLSYPALPAPPTGKPASSRTRPLTHFGNGDSIEPQKADDRNPSLDLDFPAIVGRKRDLKVCGGFMPAATKRVRSNRVVRAEDGGEASGGDGDAREGFREFDPEGSESPFKGESPDHSMENLGADLQSEKPQLMRDGVRERDPDGVELDDPSETDARDWKCMERNGVGERRRRAHVGVRMWLNGLGLDRYAGVFELHEVDEEVLPLLTLEDLKDMGINAVGSRRKMYCGIQKLGKGFPLEFG